MRKFWLMSGTLVLGAVVYNLDAITGQWKFERMCKEEGGPRFFGVVEKDVGWEVDADGAYSYQRPFELGHVAFVRFRDKQGELADVKAGKYIGPNQRDYSFSRADETQPVKYRLVYSRNVFADDQRFSRTDTQVIDVKSNKLLARHTTIGYQWAKSERVILSAPTGQTCGYERLDEFRDGLFSSMRKP